MFKAFLSHSSVDKELVRAVATSLGRQFCTFDEQVFDTGETFKVSIEKHLDKSSIFVLFATRDAIKRMWVDFEIDEAWYRVLEGKISKALVFILDSSLEYSELPRWLSRAKMSRANIPKVIAREIRHHLDDLLRIEQRPYFEGRSEDIGRLQEILRPIDEPPPRIVAVYGLPSIGKKTFIKKAVQLTLSFNRLIPLPIGESDSLADIAIKVADLFEPYSTKAGFERIVLQIRSELPEKLLNRIVTGLLIAVENKEIPVLVDEGGVYDSDGFFTEPIKLLIGAIKDEDGLYVFLTSTRKPNEEVVSMRLGPLASEAVKRLIAQIASSANLKLTNTEISEVAEYVNGYPPSTYFAVDQAKEYGIASVLADKHRLVQFRTMPFVKFLKSHVLTDNQKSILCTLARYSPLPLQVLADAHSYSTEELAKEIIALVDRSLVLPDERGLYSLAAPVADAVVSEFRGSSEENDQAIYESLKKLANSDEIDAPRLDIYRLTFKAALRSGRSSDEEVFHMTNDLIRLAEDFYHSRDHSRCIETARLALAEDPKSYSARDYLIRSLIQDEQWESAERELRELQIYAPNRDVQFLSGFLERKRGNLKKAITHFVNAEKLGRTGAALKREIASCYFHLDQIPEAKKYVLEAMASKKDNRFVIDLAIQIAMREGDELGARSGLENLVVVDVESFCKHRLSTIELRFGAADRALEAAQESVNKSEVRPTFGMLAQLATCQIRMQMHSEAERTIQRLSKLYPNQRPDIRLGLACRLAIEQKHFSRALEILNKITNSKPSIYRAMQRDAIAGELATGVMTDEQRAGYEDNLAALEKELASFDPNEAWLRLLP